MIKTETYTLPEFWANWLINGDADGYDEDEFTAMFEFAGKIVERHGKCWCIGMGDEPVGFMRHHDAADLFPYAAECAEFFFDVTPETETEQ